MKNQVIKKVVSFALLVGVFWLVYLLLDRITNDVLHTMSRENRLWGALLFSFVMFGTTVIAPLTSLPFVPMVSMYLGPFLTASACFVGWTLGAVVAFLIARYFGHPLVTRFISPRALQKLEALIPPETGFMLILVLRMCIPVDVLSYALGLVGNVSFKVYLSATMIGILWFSFAFAYGGNALMNRDYVLLAIIGVASMLVLYFSWRYARIVTRRSERNDQVTK